MEQEPKDQMITTCEDARSLARDLRAAAQHNLAALVTAARQAEDTARCHRQQLEHLADAMRCYDAALTPLTASTTAHD